MLRAGGQGQGRTADLPLFRRSVALEPIVTEMADQPCSPAFPLMRMAPCLERAHDTTRADVCRGMPFCPCCFRVDLHPSPELVLLLCWPQQPRSAIAPHLGLGPVTPARAPARGCQRRPFSTRCRQPPEDRLPPATRWPVSHPITPWPGRK